MSTNNIKNKKLNSEKIIKRLENQNGITKENEYEVNDKNYDEVVKKVDSSKINELDKRFKNTNNKLKGKKIKIKKFELEEQKLDKEIEMEDNLSIIVIIIILVGCFVLGGILGYMLYKIAMNSSNAMLMVSQFLK